MLSSHFLPLLSLVLLFIIMPSMAFDPSKIFWGSGHNVGRLMSQRRYVISKEPYCTYSEGCTDNTPYCKGDLSGYYYMSESAIHRKYHGPWNCVNGICGDERSYKACPAGTRCGCMTVCPPEVTNPCIPVDAPYPMQEKATFIFNGTTAKEWTGLAPEIEWTVKNRHVVSPPTKGNVVGMVRQDVKAGKFLQVITKQKVGYHFGVGRHSFTLILPNGADGTFVKYVGYLPEGKCKRTVIKKFEAFGSGIKDFLLNDTHVAEDGSLVQTWKYEWVVEWMIDVHFRWKWVIEADDITKTSRPLSTSYFDDQAYDDDDYQYAKTQDIRWETHDLDVDWIKQVKWYSDLWKEKGDWFRIPYLCL